jgi:hypothetical protein
MVGDEPLGVDLARFRRLEQHGCGDGVDQPCGDGDIAVPQPLQMQRHLGAMDADIGDGVARSENVLAEIECRGNADRLDRPMRRCDRPL